MNWDRIIEEKIRAAQQAGKFSNLRGQGRPLDLNEDADETSEWWTVNRLLKANGFRPDWLDDDLALREKLAQARQNLARSRDWRAGQLAALAGREEAQAIRQRVQVAEEWDRAVERFRAALVQLNADIARLNLKVPHTRFQRLTLNVDAELQQVLDGR